MRPRRIDRSDGDSHVITSAPREALALGNPDEALALGDPDDVVVVSGLDEAIASIRRRTARLAYLIIRCEYLDAWCEACDLNRAVQAADVLAFAVLPLSEASDGVRRLDVVGTAADAVLQWAPTPSAAAIRLAFGSTAHADRALWDDEMAVWLAKLAVHRPAPIRTNMHHQGRERAAPGAKVAAGR